MRRLKTFTSAFVLATVALGMSPALAESNHVNLQLLPGDSGVEGTASYVLPLKSDADSRTVLDFRVHWDGDRTGTGSLGMGQRFAPGAGDVVVGGYAFVDWAESRADNDYAQLSGGVELMGSGWELRGTWYEPLEEQTAVGPLTYVTRLSGNNALRDIFQPREATLSGFELEAALWANRLAGYDFRLSGGYYSLQSDFAPDLEGWKVRGELWSGDAYSIGVEYREDDYEDSQLFAVLRARLDFSSDKNKDRKRVLSRPISRQFGITIADPDRATPDFRGTQQIPMTVGSASVNRLTFVRSGATGNGTFETPYGSVAAAAAAAGQNETIYVLTPETAPAPGGSGPTFTGAITLKPGQQLVSSFAAPVTAGGVVLVGRGAVAPTLTATGANVVTLADNTMVNGFRITAAAGTGEANRDQYAAVYGSNVNGFTLTGNDYSGNTGTGGSSSVGVRLDNMGGVQGTRSETRHFASNAGRLPFYGSYDPGLGEANAEIISFSALSGFGVVALGDAGSVDVVRFGTGDIAGLPLSVRRDNILAGVTTSLGEAAAGDITSVSISPDGAWYAAAVQHTDDNTNGLVEIRNRSTGAVIQRVTVGIGPDGTAISPSGDWLVVANEAEDPDTAAGSITLIDTRNATTGGAVAQQIELQDQTGNFFDNSGALGSVIQIDVDGQPRRPVSHTPVGLQPEYVSFTEDGRYAVVSLQENNGAMVIDLATGAPADIRYFNLGTSTQNTDVRDTEPPAYDFTGTINGFNREPDGIGGFYAGGQFYFITADEGDNRNNYSGSRLRGGRSVSIFNGTTGELVGTTQGLDQRLFDAANAAMAANPAIYGVRNDGVNPHYYPEGRSDRGGVEPEIVTVFRDGANVYALVGLERAASVMLMDITNPASPQILSFGLLPRDMTIADDFDLAANSEGVTTLRREGRMFGYAGLEDTGTVAVWVINPTAAEKNNEDGQP